MKKNAEETHHDDEETGSEHVRNTTAQHVRNTTAQHVCNTTAQHVPDTGKEDATLSHCRLIFVHRPPSCGKTSIARGFAMTLYGSYGSYGSGNGLPLYMKPADSLWPACGQPVAILDDPGVQRFRELEQEVKVWADRYPFIAELKDHSIRTNPNGSWWPPTTRSRSSPMLPAIRPSTMRSSDAPTTADGSSTSRPTATTRTPSPSTRRPDDSTTVASRGSSRLLPTVTDLFVVQVSHALQA